MSKIKNLTDEQIIIRRKGYPNLVLNGKAEHSFKDDKEYHATRVALVPFRRKIELDLTPNGTSKEDAQAAHAHEHDEQKEHKKRGPKKKEQEAAPSEAAPAENA
jgi:hypothetical protein